SRIIEDVLDTYVLQYIEKKLRMSKNVNPKINVMIDDDRMQQVLHNGLDNEIRYIKQNGEIIITLNQIDDYWELQIKDTG
ncbi:ATP-binding protein, partial [Bacillus nitratireducens]